MLKSRNNHNQIEIVQERGGYVAYMIVPPDGGWGWVIIFVTFLGCVILDGVSFSFSSFRKPIADSLSISSTEVAMLNSIFIGIYFVACIVSCAVANRYGFRVIMIIGSVVLVISFAVTGVLTNIFEMYIVYSLIGGIGAGLVSICIVLPPGFYFDKKRPMAMGLSSCGTGVGAICVPPLIEICVNTYGWRNSLFIEGGMLSLLIILGCFLRPLEPIKVNVGLNENLQDTDSVAEQYMFTTLPDVFSIRSVMTQRSTMQTNNAVTDYPTISHLADTARGSISLENAPPGMLPRLQQMMTSSRMGESMSSTTIQRRVLGNISKAELKPKAPQKNISKQKKILGARPLYRTDVLYQGSLMRLDTYTEKDKEIEYHMDVTRPATQKDITEETERKCLLCPEAIRRGLSTLIDCKLLKSPTFLCLAFCALFNYISFYIPFLYIGERAQTFGMGKYDTILVSMIGIGLTIGRILSGIVITIYPKFSALVCTILTCNIAGLAALATTWYNQVAYQIVCMTIFGFAAGIFSPLRSIMIVDFMGLDQLTTATGMIIFFQGIGSLVGPPIADFAQNSLKDTNAPFYITSVSLFLSALILLPMKMIYKWETKRRSLSFNIHHRPAM